jgi:hypothetical protein
VADIGDAGARLRQMNDVLDENDRMRAERQRMRDILGPIACGILSVCLLWCLHRIAVVSHRVDMAIMVQQSQQSSINRMLERDSDLLLKIGRLEQQIEGK